MYIQHPEAVVIGLLTIGFVCGVVWTHVLFWFWARKVSQKTTLGMPEPLRTPPPPDHYDDHGHVVRR